MSTNDDAIESWGPEQMLRFEELLTDLSARFINLPADQVDTAIKDAQRQVCDSLGLDAAALWQWDVANPKILVLTHHHLPPGAPPVPERMDASLYFPWSFHEVSAGRISLVPCMDEVPEGAERDRESWCHFGVKNVLTFPLCAGGVPFGALSFHDMVVPRTWSWRLVKRLGLAADIFANAIVRKRSDQVLRESETRVVLATEAAGAGLWMFDAEDAYFWVGDKIMELFGLPPGDRLEMERFISLVYADDRQIVRDVLERAVRSRELAVVEYRIVRPGGQIRWMQSRGRSSLDATGRTVKLMGITVDITTRKNAQEALQKSEARLASAVDVAGLGFYEVLDGENVVFVDSRARVFCGVPGEQDDGALVLQFWAEHLHSEDRPRIMDMLRQLNEGTLDQVTVTYRYMHPLRGLVWMHHLIHVLERDAGGRAVRTIGVFQDITAQKVAEQELKQALEEIQQLRDRLQSENVYLREQVRHEAGYGAIIGESELVQKMIAMARKVASTDSAVLITGETGTGKELLAQAIHDLSSRKGKTMVKVNCAALPAALIESELFGREKGAYTGAMTQQAGRFEVADGSTIFLDEIGDLPLDLQTKLLRVLQDGQYERLGSTRTLKTNVRVVAATNRNLGAMVAKGTFREDLFHRLNVFPIEVPPLRARVDDIPLMVWSFVQEFNAKMGRSVDAIPKPVMARLKRYPWPGNVRELRNVIERAMIVSEGCSLRVELPESGPSTSLPSATLEDVERKHILDVLERTHWKISGKGGAAEILGLVPTTLQSRLKKLGLSRPQP